jgi:hypothetical protein
VKVRLIAEVLDNQLFDSTGREAGKVDGIVIELRSDRPPKVSYIEVGPITLLERFSRRLARWYARLDAHFGDGRGQPIRIPWTRVRREEVALRLDLDAESTPIFAVENWLSKNIVDRIPGGRQS